MAKKRTSRRSRKRRKTSKDSTIFRKHNYVLLAICVAAIATGYVLMRVENQLEGVISLYVSPLLIMAGHLGVMYAIMWLPEHDSSSDS